MKTRFRADVVVDGTGADPVRGGAVDVDGDRIVSVTAAGADQSFEIVDLEGCTLVPGLIDAHVHLGLAVNLSALTAGTVSVAECAAATFLLCGAALDEGFTTVRDTGGIDAGVGLAITAGLVRGPRVLSCGPLLAQTGGHGHFVGPFAPPDAHTFQDVPGLFAATRVCDGADDVRRAAREAFRRGAGFLKMCVSGGVTSLSDELADTQFSKMEISAAVGEARRRHSYVTVHAHNDDAARAALAAGVACIEHGTGLTQETASWMARVGAHLVPTLAVAHTYLQNADVIGLPEHVRDRVQGVEQGMTEAMMTARAAGVVVGSGSDYIGPDQSGRALEIVLRAPIVGAVEAISMATRNNALILGVGDSLGTIEPGKTADLVAVAGDVINEPQLLLDPANVVLVVKDGRVVKDIRPMNTARELSA